MKRNCYCFSKEFSSPFILQFPMLISLWEDCDFLGVTGGQKERKATSNVLLCHFKKKNLMNFVRQGKILIAQWNCCYHFGETAITNPGMFWTVFPCSLLKHMSGLQSSLQTEATATALISVWTLSEEEYFLTCTTQKIFSAHAFQVIPCFICA